MCTIAKYYELEKSLNESIYLYNEPSLDILLEMLSIKLDMDDYLPTTLNENVNIIIGYPEFMPLIEAVDEIAELNKNMKDLKSDKNNENIFNKCKKSLKSVIDWWYKVDPDKKFKTLHVVLKVLVIVLSIVASIYFGHKAVKFVGNTNLYKNIPDKVFKVGKSEISVKKYLMSTLVLDGVGKIEIFLGKLLSKAEYSVNKKDIDKNIAEFDKSIDKINEQISNTDDPKLKSELEKTKAKLSSSLSKLIKMRDNNKKE